MILILDHRSDSQPIAPLLLTPEPRLRKCSAQTCLQRLGVYQPGQPKPRNPAGAPPGAMLSSNPANTSAQRIAPAHAQVPAPKPRHGH